MWRGEVTTLKTVLTLRKTRWQHKKIHTKKGEVIFKNNGFNCCRHEKIHGLKKHQDFETGHGHRNFENTHHQQKYDTNKTFVTTPKRVQGQNCEKNSLKNTVYDSSQLFTGRKGLRNFKLCLPTLKQCFYKHSISENASGTQNTFTEFAIRKNEFCEANFNGKIGYSNRTRSNLKFPETLETPAPSRMAPRRLLQTRNYMDEASELLPSFRKIRKYQMNEKFTKTSIENGNENFPVCTVTSYIKLSQNINTPSSSGCPSPISKEIPVTQCHEKNWACLEKFALNTSKICVKEKLRLQQNLNDKRGEELKDLIHFYDSSFKTSQSALKSKFGNVCKFDNRQKIGVKQCFTPILASNIRMYSLGDPKIKSQIYLTILENKNVETKLNSSQNDSSANKESFKYSSLTKYSTNPKHGSSQLCMTAANNSPLPNLLPKTPIHTFSPTTRPFSTKSPSQPFLPSLQTRNCVRVTAAETQDFREIPSPKGLPIIGTTLSLIAAGSAPRLHEYIHRRHQELGPVFKESIGPVSAVFVSDPMEMRSVFNQEGKYPKHVLPEAWTLYNRVYNCERGIFFMDGEEWLHFRRILNKLMLKADGMYWINDPCEQVASIIVDRWASLIGKNGKAVIPNLEGELYRFSIDTVIAVLLGDKYEECIQLLEPEVQEMASVVNLIFKTSAKLSLIPASLAAALRLPAWKNFVRAADDGLHIAHKLMTKLISECPKGNGILARMQEENMSKKDIVRIVADLILAAGDTTAYSMQWILFLMAKHKDAQDKLVEMNDTPHETNLIKNIIREALRMYPVAPFLTRILPQDTLLGGYVIPSNTLIIMSLYTSSRDPNNFPLPEKFWPERWNRTGGNTYLAASPHASLPFAMGTRSCIGRKIAEMQMHMALKKISNSFNMKLLNEKDVEMVLRLVSVPSVPIDIEISCRS